MRYRSQDELGSRSRESRRGRHGDSGRHGSGGRKRRGGRLFGHGDLRLLILHLISDRPRHGYELIKAIEDELHGSYSPSPGVVYPILTMLVEMGHATVGSPDGTRKPYEITAAGVSFLEENRIAVAKVTALLKEAGASERSSPPPQIVRATENLKLALHLRQNQGSLTPEQIRSIAAALDAAAVAIEES